MMSSATLKKFDALIRCTNVLAEGTENEFYNFTAHQEKCRKKWTAAEKESTVTKSHMTKYTAEHDTLQVKLKMARHQLDTEMRRRLRAEQQVDHLTRQLQLIKELVLDKDADKQILIQSIYQHEKTIGAQAQAHARESIESLTDDDPSIDLSYDISADDILDDTGDLLGDRNNNKGGKKVLLKNPRSKTDLTEGNGKKIRFSGADGYFV